MGLTTKKDFQIFSKEAEKWIKLFNLSDWRVSLFHKSGEENALASFSAYPIDKVASLFLEPDWQDNVINNHSLKKRAFHEVLHVLFARLTFLGGLRYIMPDDIGNEEHAIIHRLESIFYGGTEYEHGSGTRSRNTQYYNKRKRNKR